jgi:hypothetical protein
MPATATPTEEDIAIWSQGARTVKNAMAEFNLSRAQLWALMNDGTLRWCAQDGYRGTRLIAYADLVRFVAGLYASQK